MSDFYISKNNKDLILEGLDMDIEKALEECGLKAEGFAKGKCPVDTGALRNSITYKVIEDESAMYVGTNMEYAPYIEFGTGQYVIGGRRTPWVYQDIKGAWHRTNGQKARPYIKPAISDNVATYKAIFLSNLK